MAEVTCSNLEADHKLLTCKNKFSFDNFADGRFPAADVIFFKLSKPGFMRKTAETASRPGRMGYFHLCKHNADFFFDSDSFSSFSREKAFAI